MDPQCQSWYVIVRKYKTNKHTPQGSCSLFMGATSEEEEQSGVCGWFVPKR